VTCSDENQETAGPIYLRFMHLAATVLYGGALRECLLEAEWSRTGTWVFLALMVTIIRLFFSYILFEGFHRNNIRQCKAGYFLEFWLAVTLAGTATLAAHHQTEVRLLYFLIAMVVVDFLWQLKALRGLSHENNCGQLVFRTKAALDVVAAAFFALIWVLLSGPDGAGSHLSQQVATIIVLALALISAIDFVLNARFYRLR